MRKRVSIGRMCLRLHDTCVVASLHRCRDSPVQTSARFAVFGARLAAIRDFVEESTSGWTE